MGHYDGEDTTKAPEGIADSPTWISKYLNSRYFSFPQGVTVRVHEGCGPSGMPSNIRTLTGMESYLEDHAVGSGVVKLSGDLAHWWILEDGSHLSSDAGFIQSSGHAAAHYQSELYEMHSGNQGISMLQRCGVIFGGRRVVVYFEPRPGTNVEVTSNTARSPLLLNNQPLPWDDWARQFRKKLPAQLRRFVEQQGALASGRDHTHTVRHRISKVSHLFTPSRYRLNPSGTDLVDDQRAGADAQAAQATDGHRVSDQTKEASGGQKNHKVGSLKDQGKPANRLTEPDYPVVKWISVKDATRPPEFIEDRAACLLPDQNILQINDDFTVLNDLISFCCKDVADFPNVKDFVATLVRTWYEQALVETVLGMRALRNRKEWSNREVEKALSPEALTASAMQKYHVVTCTREDLLRKLPGLPRVALLQST